MSNIIDVSSDCGDRAHLLRAAGVRTVIRYYSRDTGRPAKRLSAAEASKLTAAGLRLGVVHEARHGDKISAFSADLGTLDGDHAHKYGAAVIGQPAGSTIYFAVDFDATAAEITAQILPYFRAVKAAMETLGAPVYQIGVYGSGATCTAVAAEGLAQRTWLAQSTGWMGYKAYRDSGQWSLLQGPAGAVANVPCDPGTAGPDGIGDFALGVGGLAALTEPQTVGLMYTTARSGLNLRAGAGTQFDIRRLLPLGTPVHMIKAVGGWTQVDLQGDGAADGFVSSDYLTLRAQQGSDVIAGGTVGGDVLDKPDRTRIAALIQQGTTAAGLKAARITAKAAHSAYPSNGCAAHLSALLQQAGIPVAMTLGAGALAHLIARRGWIRIAVGQQRPGDIGVTYDLDPSRPGADHIYLVLETHGADEMLIADNQRSEDAPHLRFASGRGKTRTEYFLRA